MDSNAKAYRSGRLPAHITCDNQHKKSKKYVHRNIYIYMLMEGYICNSFVVHSKVC